MARTARLSLIILVLALAACGGGGGSGSPQNSSCPAPLLDAKRPHSVDVLTNFGGFRIRLDVEDSPCVTSAFASLARKHFFDGTIFHRIVPGFVIQGGDPTGTGTGGPGYTVVEPPPKDIQYVRGDVAMAKTQTDPSGASGSQFFIVTAPNVTQSAGLTPDYALLGKVVSGLAVVQRIGALPTNPAGDGAPISPVVMSRVTVAAS